MLLLPVLCWILPVKSSATVCGETAPLAVLFIGNVRLRPVCVVPSAALVLVSAPLELKFSVPILPAVEPVTLPS